MQIKHVLANGAEVKSVAGKVINKRYSICNFAASYSERQSLNMPEVDRLIEILTKLKGEI